MPATHARPFPCRPGFRCLPVIAAPVASIVPAVIPITATVTSVSAVPVAASVALVPVSIVLARIAGEGRTRDTQNQQQTKT